MHISVSNGRYLHVPQTADGSSGSSRRGSAPAVFPSALAGRALADRRGSEPSILPARGVYGMNRRGSEPLVTSMSMLQQNFERLTAGIAEEEEYGIVEDAPSQQQGTSYSFFFPLKSVLWCLPALVFFCRSVKATKWCYSQQYVKQLQLGRLRA